MRNNRWRQLALVMAMMASVSGLSLPVRADPYPGVGVFQDGGSHFACWVPNPVTATIPGPIWEHLFLYMDGTLKAQTGIDIAWTHDCSNLADMRLDDRLNDPGLYGVWICINVSGTTCLGGNVNINLNTINPAAAAAGLSAAAVQRYNWCHESGHSLGLGHENACMQTGVHTDNFYSAHHVTHIDAQF
jgi:hypothetical protein